MNTSNNYHYQLQLIREANACPRDGMAVAAAVGGDILYLLPSRPDLEARTTEICVQVNITIMLVFIILS